MKKIKMVAFCLLLALSQLHAQVRLSVVKLNNSEIEFVMPNANIDSSKLYASNVLIDLLFTIKDGQYILQSGMEGNMYFTMDSLKSCIKNPGKPYLVTRERNWENNKVSIKWATYYPEQNRVVVSSKQISLINSNWGLLNLLYIIIAVIIFWICV